MGTSILPSFTINIALDLRLSTSSSLPPFRRRSKLQICAVNPPPDDSEARSDLSSGDDHAPWTLLTERLSRLREKEVVRDRKLAHNWQVGVYTQSIVASLAEDYIRRVSFCDDILAYGSTSGTLTLAHMPTGKTVQNHHVHVGQITALHYAGTHLVSAGANDFSVAIWNSAPYLSSRFWTSCTDDGDTSLQFSKPQYFIEDHTAVVTDVVIDASANRLYTSCVDGLVRIYDLHTGRLELSINVGEPIYALVLTDTKYLLCGCKSGNVCAYEAQRGVSLLSFRCHPSNTTALDFCEDTQTLVTGDASGAIRVWSFHDSICIGDIPGHSAAVMSVQVDHSKVVTTGRDGCINVSMLSSLQRAYSIPGYTPYLTSAYFDDRRLISDGSNDVIICNYYDVDTDVDAQCDRS